MEANKKEYTMNEAALDLLRLVLDRLIEEEHTEVLTLELVVKMLEASK